MRISDWSSDVCSSDLIDPGIRQAVRELATHDAYDALLREDPAIAARLKPADRTRIARALEVSRSTGRSILTWREDRTGGIGGEINLRAAVLDRKSTRPNYSP